MPGWYIHMEAARLAAERLGAGTCPPTTASTRQRPSGSGQSPTNGATTSPSARSAPTCSTCCRTSRSQSEGRCSASPSGSSTCGHIVEEEFLGPWEKWMGPVGANDAQFAAQLTGGLSQQLAQALDLRRRQHCNAMQTAVTRSTDVFGLLTSGVPQGTRGVRASTGRTCCTTGAPMTYHGPSPAWPAQSEAAATTDDERADAEAGQAFALGWMSHCATDVVGTRVHQREVRWPIPAALAATPPRREPLRLPRLRQSARHRQPLPRHRHVRAALPHRLAHRVTIAPYNGRRDAPAYDYFAGFPAYPLGDTPRGRPDPPPALLDGTRHPSHEPRHPAHGHAARGVRRHHSPTSPPRCWMPPAFSDAGRPNDGCDARYVAGRVPLP